MEKKVEELKEMIDFLKEFSKTFSNDKDVKRSFEGVIFILNEYILKSPKPELGEILPYPFK